MDLGRNFLRRGFVVQLLWEGGGAKARADVFRRDLSSKKIRGGPSELWFVKDGLPSSQAGVGSPLLEFSKGCSGGIRVVFLRGGW